jgi:hypothetical protein
MLKAFTKDCTATAAAAAARSDSLMKNYYYAIRCFLLDFWQHSLGECAPSANPSLHRAIYQAADTNITSLLGSNVITDVPRCLHLVGGGRVCWVHCVRGEEFAAADPQVILLILAAVLQDRNVFAAVARLTCATLHTATRDMCRV